METLPALSSLSPADLNLITTLWLQDLSEISSHRKHKAREDTPPDDNTLAFDYLARDLQNAQLTSRDVQLARSVASALEADRDILEEVVREEESALRDRDIALELSRPGSAMSMRSSRSGTTLFRSATPLSSSQRAESSQQASRRSIRFVPPP